MVRDIKKISVKALCICVCLLFLTSCSLFPDEVTRETEAPPIIPRVMAEVQVNTHVVEAGDIINDFTAIGTVIPVVRHDVVLDVPSATVIDHNLGDFVNEFRNVIGRSAAITRANLRVEAGDVLVTFGNESLIELLPTFERAVELAQLDHNTAVRNRNNANADFNVLQYTTTRDIWLAEQVFNNARQRFEAGELSDMEFAQAEVTFLNTVQRLNRGLEAAANRGAENDAVRRTRIHLETAQEALREIQEQIDNLDVRAPIDGILTFFADFQIGREFNQNQLLFSVADDTSFFISVTGPGAQRSHLLPGSDVDIIAQAIIGGVVYETRFKGVVISHPPEAGDGRFIIPDNVILIMSLDWPENVTIDSHRIYVIFNIESSHNVVVIPINGLYEFGTYSFVRIFEDGIITERAVALGIRDDTHVEIISGLSIGETIVLR